MRSCERVQVGPELQLCYYILSWSYFSKSKRHLCIYFSTLNSGIYSVTEYIFLSPLVSVLAHVISLCVSVCVGVVRKRWAVGQIVVSKIIILSSKLLFSLLVTSVDGHASFPRFFHVPLPMAVLQPQSIPPPIHHHHHRHPLHSSMQHPSWTGGKWSPSLSLWLELNQTSLTECCVMWWWSLGGSLMYLIQPSAPPGALSAMFCNHEMRDNCQTGPRKYDSVYGARYSADCQRH